MGLASAIGRDRPDSGARLTVVVDDARMSSQTRWSSETELTAAVARTRDGRRVRLALGSEITLCWSHLDGVRSRRYQVVDVLGGGDPQWRLHPLAPAESGNRRFAPRADVAVPVGVQGDAGLVVGTTLDLSVSGARIAFPANVPGTPLRPLPDTGQTARVVLVLDDVRLELVAEVVRLDARSDGSREIRAAFSDLDEAARDTLRAAVDQLLAAPVS
ncbi:PilZ domain-containing protein [Modestobacter sp. Leaf380]|uniref:PilZ domain-containing protein n=1 Tax=Modestobacter sp. Leaf380 TaxID=1736356 RepID=UPI0006FB4324|nr:PilZ domain-containing protein [Modestobacter sp. Leaf380]KQS73769.1 hypothetical protein ASG41_04060 [Modestobacter sp. Leaf380]